MKPSHTQMGATANWRKRATSDAKPAASPVGSAMKNRSFTFFMTLPDTEGGGEGEEGKASTPRGGTDGKGAVQMSYISDPNSKVSNPRKVPAFDALFTADRTANKIVVRL